MSTITSTPTTSLPCPSLRPIRGMGLVAAAVVWGGLVFAISSFVGLMLFMGAKRAH